MAKWSNQAHGSQARWSLSWTCFQCLLRGGSAGQTASECAANAPGKGADRGGSSALRHGSRPQPSCPRHISGPLSLEALGGEEERHKVDKSARD
eukprot:5721719-Amphidinium_carterae.1